MSDVISVKVIADQLFIKAVSPDENTMERGLADTRNDFNLFRHCNPPMRV
jgi:hypothetical protein